MTVAVAQYGLLRNNCSTYNYERLFAQLTLSEKYVYVIDHFIHSNEIFAGHETGKVRKKVTTQQLPSLILFGFLDFGWVFGGRFLAHTRTHKHIRTHTHYSDNLAALFIQMQYLLDSDPPAPASRFGFSSSSSSIFFLGCSRLPGEIRITHTSIFLYLKIIQNVGLRQLRKNW